MDILQQYLNLIANIIVTTAVAIPDEIGHKKIVQRKNVIFE